MIEAAHIREHMNVLSADGEHVGTVDHMDGTRIKLTRTDSAAGGKHHYVPFTWAGDIEGDDLRLTHPAAFVFDNWTAEDDRSGPEAAHTGGNETGMSRDSLGQSATDDEAGKRKATSADGA